MSEFPQGGRGSFDPNLTTDASQWHRKWEMKMSRRTPIGAKRIKSLRIYQTRNYDLFVRDPFSPGPSVRMNLEKSMRKDGYIAWLPLIVVRCSDGKLMVKDGQARLESAKSLSLPVTFLIVESFQLTWGCCTSGLAKETLELLSKPPSL